MDRAYEGNETRQLALVVSHQGDCQSPPFVENIQRTSCPYDVRPTTSNATWLRPRSRRPAYRPRICHHGAVFDPSSPRRCSARPSRPLRRDGPGPPRRGAAGGQAASGLGALRPNGGWVTVGHHFLPNRQSMAFRNGAGRHTRGYVKSGHEASVWLVPIHAADFGRREAKRTSPAATRAANMRPHSLPARGWRPAPVPSRYRRTTSS